MIKSLIGALMVSVLSAPQPKIDIPIDYDTGITITNTTNEPIILNQSAGTFPAYYYQSATKTNYKIHNPNFDIVGTQYAYTYGTPYTLSTPNTKYAMVDSGLDMTMITLPHRPFYINVININNYRNFDTAEIKIYCDYSMFNSNYEKNITIYTSNNNQMIDYLNNPNWNIANNNFYRDVKQQLDNDLYTEELLNMHTDDNYISIDSDETDILNTAGNKYIVILCYITTDDLTANSSITYNPTQALGQITAQSSYSNSYEESPTINTTNYEVIDLPNLMFTILTMPFSFISQAFNLRLFTGTPYALNISDLFLAVIATFALIFIIKLIISKAG